MFPLPSSSGVGVAVCAVCLKLVGSVRGGCLWQMEVGVGCKCMYVCVAVVGLCARHEGFEGQCVHLWARFIQECGT